MKSIAPAGAIAQARHRAAGCWGHSHHHRCQRLRSDGYQGPRGSWEVQEQSSHTPCAPKHQEELREILWESWRKSIQCLLAPPSPATHQKWPTKKKKNTRITKLPRKRPEVLGDQTAQPREGTAGSSASLQAHTQRGRATSTAWAPTPNTTPAGFCKAGRQEKTAVGAQTAPLLFFRGKYTRFG